MGKWSDDARLKKFQAIHGTERGRQLFEERKAKEAERAGVLPPAPAKDSGEIPPIRSESTKGGRQERTPNRRKPTEREVRTVLDASIAFADQGACLVFPTWQEERLTAEERARLADALVDEVLHSDKLTKWYIRTTTVTRHGKLMYALATIALPRLQRRGLIPGVEGEPQAAESQYPTVQMEPVGTYDGDRDDGVGQVGATSQPPNPTEVLGRLKVEV